MNKPLSGAVFQLFEVGNGASGDVQRNGKWYKPVTYLHAYNHEDDAHYAAADLTAEDTLLGSMTVGETGNLYPTRLHHSVGDAIYFMTLPAGNGYAAGYTDIHLSQARDGLALERGKQYYLLEVVTPEGYEKEDIFWSFIIDDMDFFDSRNGIYQYRDGGVLTVSNETQDDSGIVLSKKFDGDAADAMDWDQVEFEIVGKDGDNVIYRREVSYSDFVKKKLKLTDIPAGAYTITEKNADDVTLTRETSMTITKEGGEAVTPEQTDGDSYVRFSVTQEDIDSGTAFYVAFTNTYTEKPLDIELSKEWGEDALARLSDKTLTLALFRDGEEYPLYQDAEGKYRFWSEEDAAHDRSYITLSNATTWTANIRELPRYEDGRAIEWTVKEIGASYSQDGVRYTVSEEDMDVQFIITAKAQTGTDTETEEPIYETVPVSQCTAALDTTSSEITNLTLTNELATLKIVTVEKEWYDEDGNMVPDKTDDDAVVYDLYRTTEELPKGGKERNTLKVLPYRSDSTHLSDMEHILTNEIEVANGDVLEFEVEALAKNVNAAGTWWAWWFDFTSPVIHLDCSPWEQSLSIISVKNEMGEDLADVPTTRYSNSAYSQTAKNPKVYIQVVINNVEHINGHQNSLPEYRNTPSLLLRNWKDANITVRNATQESENLTHAKLQAFVDTHPNTAELYREGITLDQLHSWQESSNYPDGYTYFAIERTPAGYADTYSIVDNEDGSETITIKNAPIDTSEPGNLGTLTVTKAVAGLPSESHGDMEFKFQIKNGTKYLVRTHEGTYELLPLAALTTAGYSLDADATFTVKAGETVTFTGLLPAIYTLEEVDLSAVQVSGYALKVSYTGNGLIGVNAGQTKNAEITNQYVPEKTDLTFGKVWAGSDNKPAVWPKNQAIEVEIFRSYHGKTDDSFRLVYTMDANGAVLKSKTVPAAEVLDDLAITFLADDASAPYYAYRYTLSGLPEKILAGDDAGEKWTYYAVEKVPADANYAASYGMLNGTAVSVSADKANAEAKQAPALTETDYIINQISQKEIRFTKNWFDGVSDEVLASWPQREKMRPVDSDGNVIDPEAAAEFEDVPITVTLRRRLDYGTAGNPLLTDFDPNFSVSFSNLTSAVRTREQTINEGKLTLTMQQTAETGNFVYTVSGLREKGSMDGRSGTWVYYVTESSMDGYGASYILSTGAASDGNYTNEGGTIRNTKKLGTLVVTKAVTGLTDEELADKEFTVTIRSGERYLTADTGLTDAETRFAIQSGGKLVFTNVPAGSYEIVEDEDSAQAYGYTLEVTVSDDGKVTITDDDVKTVTITNTYAKDTTDFSFTKVWYGLDWSVPGEWQTDPITVTLTRSLVSGDETVSGEPVTMTIYQVGGNSVYDYTVTKSTEPFIAYFVEIKELEKWVPADMLPKGVESGEWTYTLTETVPNGYYARYFMKDNSSYQGAQQVDDGGRIENHLAGYALPNTGGAGTASFYVVGVLLCGTACLIVLKRRKTE